MQLGTKDAPVVASFSLNHLDIVKLEVRPERVRCPKCGNYPSHDCRRPGPKGYVRFLDQVSKDDIGLVGGKGANLGEMHKAGLAVPDAFVVTTTDHRLEGVSRYISPQFEGAFRMELKAMKKVRDDLKLTNVWAMLPFVRTTWR